MISKGLIQGNINDVKKRMNMLNERVVKMGERRMAICKVCPILTTELKCSKEKGGCGCNMRKKVLAPASACPKRKWGTEDL
jgi:hypothetical protein